MNALLLREMYLCLPCLGHTSSTYGIPSSPTLTAVRVGIDEAYPKNY